MSQPTHKQPQTSKRTADQEIDKPPANQQDEKLTETIDSMLEEIDGVLEKNAETFVMNYVQKGGQ